MQGGIEIGIAADAVGLVVGVDEEGLGVQLRFDLVFA